MKAKSCTEQDSYTGQVEEGEDPKGEIGYVKIMWSQRSEA